MNALSEINLEGVLAGVDEAQLEQRRQRGDGAQRVPPHPHELGVHALGEVAEVGEASVAGGHEQHLHRRGVGAQEFAASVRTTNMEIGKLPERLTFWVIVCLLRLL